MKIDSPTFLTETTFVSASVQFSSGSQKFGDTSDDLHQFTGSQSTTGTGSFGRVENVSTIEANRYSIGVSLITVKFTTMLMVILFMNQEIVMI